MDGNGQGGSIAGGAEGGGDGAQGEAGAGGGGDGVGGVDPEAAAAGIDALALHELVEEGFAPADGAAVFEEHGFLAGAVEGVGEEGVGEIGVLGREIRAGEDGGEGKIG